MDKVSDITPDMLRKFAKQMFDDRAVVEHGIVRVYDPNGQWLASWEGSVRECYAFLFGWASGASY